MYPDSLNRPWEHLLSPQGREDAKNLCERPNFFYENEILVVILRVFAP